MILIIVRALFVLLMTGLGWAIVRSPQRPAGDYQWLAVMICLVTGTLFVCLDILAPRRKLSLFAGTLFGLLVGIFLSYGLSFVVTIVVDQVLPNQPDAYKQPIIHFANLAIGICTCYFAISFILQTKDDFRFIIPYVEFSKQTKGTRPIILDTSVLIDGRIADVAGTGIFESQMVVPHFVLQELQTIADHGDKLKRNRGRRGLDVLAKLQQHKRLEVVLYDSSAREEVVPVDERLMELAKHLNARVLTNDFNLNKVAQLRGVDVININELAQALKPIVLPGERMTVRLAKPGEEPQQAVGYLPDGTMVVVENAIAKLNEEVEFVVTSALQTHAGRMIFGRLPEAAPPARKPRSHTDTSTAAS